MVDEVYLKAQRQKEEEKRKKEEKRKAAAANQGAFSQGFQVKREKSAIFFLLILLDIVGRFMGKLSWVICKGSC